MAKKKRNPFDPDSSDNDFDNVPSFDEIDRILRQRHQAENSIIRSVESNIKKESHKLWVSLLRRFGRLSVDKSGNIKPTQDNVGRSEEISLFASRGIKQIVNKSVKNLIEGTGRLSPFYEKEVSQIMYGRRSITKKTIRNIISSKHARAVLTTNLENFRDAGNALVRKLRRELTGSLFTRIAPNEIADKIRPHIKGVDKQGNSLKKYAKVYAQTAYNAYAGAISNDATSDQDVAAYRYSGPADGKNRPFPCGKYVKQVVPKEEMLAVIEQTPGATLHNPGGWNCRHKLHPIFRDDPRLESLLNG